LSPTPTQAVHTNDPIITKDSEIKSTIQPEIIIHEAVFEGDIEYFSNVWMTANGDPITNARISVELYDKGDDKVYSYSTETSQNGSYQLLFNYTNLVPENYYWLVHFEKSGYQEWKNIRINITILPHTFRFNIEFNEELIQGETYYSSVIVYYANVQNQTITSPYNTYIPISGPVTDVQVLMSLNLLYEDGSEVRTTKAGITDENGVGLIYLTSEETEGLQSIESVSYVVEESHYNHGVAQTVPESEFPEIITTKEPRIIQMINENLYLLVSSLIIMFIVIFLRRRLIPRKNRPIDQTYPDHAQPPL
jgi:hypothetical protein